MGKVFRSWKLKFFPVYFSLLFTAQNLEAYEMKRMNKRFLCSYLGYMNKFGNNVGPLLWRCSVEHNRLDPLWKSVKQSDTSFQHWVIFQSAIIRVWFKVLKLENKRHSQYVHIERDRVPSIKYIELLPLRTYRVVQKQSDFPAKHSK